MKLKVSTPIFQKMISNAVKGASNNQMLPITELICIKVEGEVLTTITTDASTYLYCRECCPDVEDFYVTVEMSTFSKLISRFTSEFITLEVSDNVLIVTGNGKYKIPIPIDEDGEMVKFPDPLFSFNAEVEESIDIEQLRKVNNTAKASLAKTLYMPCYTGYYMDDECCIATDSKQLCRISASFLDNPTLIPADIISLTNIITEPNGLVAHEADTIVLYSEHIVIYGKVMDCLSDFRIDTIKGLFTQKLDYYCKVEKQDLLQVLNRLVLVSSGFDVDNPIQISFTNDYMELSSKSGENKETIEYLADSDIKPVTYLISIDMLLAQVKALTDDVVEIHYGNGAFISIVNDNVTQLICLIHN